MTNNIVFDFDGVLIDSKRMYVELIRKSLLEFGLSISFEDISDKLIPLITGTIERILPVDTKTRDIMLNQIVERVIELTSLEGLNYISLCNDADNTLEHLKGNNYNLFLLSNSHSTFINKVLTHYNLNQYFDEIITLDSGFTSKDEALNHILIMENIAPGNLVYVGDTRADVTLATNVGCKIVIILNEISWDFHKRQEIIELGPDFIIDKMHDLLPLMESL